MNEVIRTQRPLVLFLRNPSKLTSIPPASPHRCLSHDPNLPTLEAVPLEVITTNQGRSSRLTFHATASQHEFHLIPPN